MINKLILQNLIKKYYLDGLSNAVTWDIEDNNINVKTVSLNKDLVSVINYRDVNLVDNQLHIFDTFQLNKLVNILDDEIFIDFHKKNNSLLKLLISDNKFNLKYSLGNKTLIPNAPEITEPEYDASLTLEMGDILDIIKAKSALNDAEDIIITDDMGMGVEFQLGRDDDYSNRISYTLQNQVDVSSFKLKVPANYIKEIFTSNKDALIGKLSIFYNGLVKFSFEGEDWTSSYFIVSNN